MQTDGNGLLHMRARYYHPLIRRFVNSDPARDLWNWFAYAGGNPLFFIDPTGLGQTIAGNAFSSDGGGPFAGLSLIGFDVDAFNAGINAEIAADDAFATNAFAIPAAGYGFLQDQFDWFGITPEVDAEFSASSSFGENASATLDTVFFFKGGLKLGVKNTLGAANKIDDLPLQGPPNAKVRTSNRPGNQQAVELQNVDGSVKDISPTRVKEFVPNTHPNAPPGALNPVKFDNALPGSKGKKRAPTQDELDILRRTGG